MVLLKQVSDEVLSFLAGQVNGEGGHFGSVAVALPVDADSLESCVAECGRKSGVPAAYFKCSDFLVAKANGDLKSGEVRWFDVRFNAFAIFGYRR